MNWKRTTRAAAVFAGIALLGGAAEAAPTLEQYRHFRALSIDLQGRIPTAAELTAFEAPGFDLDGWIDAHLSGAAYAERLRRVYMDLLRLEIGNAFIFVSNPMVLRRARLNDPDGNPVYVYFRRGQRRDRVESDADFCMSPAETGVTIAANGTTTGTPINIDPAVWAARTVEVRPWWLYQDYRAAAPTQRIDPTNTMSTMALSPVTSLLTDADGHTNTVTVRICREEAQTAATAPMFLSGRNAALPTTMPYPGGRVTAPPADSSYARMHATDMVDCTSGTGISLANGCGCGTGLERCMPGNSLGNDPQAFNLPNYVPLGMDAPLDNAPQTQGDWSRFWWSQEAQHFLEDLFASDRDMRAMLTDRGTLVNGALAQFYRGFAGTTCCGSGTQFNYLAPTALFDPANVPGDLTAHQLTTWRRIADRGPNAAGILTMPIFLTKYGTRRARAHAMYGAFLCRQFIAENVALTPSTEPNLMVRPGCQACHATLEPLAAYFSRITESGWTFLPAANFPTLSPACVNRGTASPNGGCAQFYDPAFSTTTNGVLRGAYGSNEHADQGAAGIAQAMTNDPAFPGCVAQNVAESFLGRSLTPDDAALRASLATALSSNGFHMRALVRALVHSDAYHDANNLDSATWRAGQAGQAAPQGGM